MLTDYIVKLLIFLLILMLISNLSEISVYKLFNGSMFSLKEGMDECSQNEKDELYKQKMKIDKMADSTSKMKGRLANLEKEIATNKQKIGENNTKLKSVVDKSKQEKKQAEKQSESVKFD
jgi:hypothetical protein